MSEWSDHQYLLKYHPEVTGYSVAKGADVRIGLVFKEWVRSNLANLKYLGRSGTRGREREVLVFAETVNQHASLKAMVSALGDRCSYIMAAEFGDAWDAENAICSEQKFELTALDALRALIKSTVLLPHILRESKRYEGGLGRFYVRQLFRSCGYWFWLRGLLRAYPSKWLLTANDHNPWNLMLYELARSDGRKTAYVQHASVSNIFPPLDFDVAFLDGPISWEVYQNIAVSARRPAFAGDVCLCGQQKRLGGKRISSKVQVLGIATSSLTGLDVLLEVLKRLSMEGWQMVLRSHPTESPDRLEAYDEWAESIPGLLFQKGTLPLARFLGVVDMVIAGDSSILLETAVSGRCAVYMRELSGRGMDDYYGFVQNGIALRMDASRDVGLQIRQWEAHMDSLVYSQSVARYSTSFGTEWFGKEGKWAVSQWEGLGLSS